MPTSVELLKEISGKAVVDLTDPADPGKIVLRAGEQVAGFGVLRDDGSTSCGNWRWA